MYKALVVVIVAMVEEEGVEGNLVTDEGGHGWVHQADLQLQHRLLVLHLGLAVLVQDQDFLLLILIQVRSFSSFYSRLSYILIVLPVYFHFWVLMLLHLPQRQLHHLGCDGGGVVPGPRAGQQPP